MGAEVHLGNVLGVDEHGAVHDLHHAEEGEDQGGLAGARPADDGDVLAGLQDHIHFLENDVDPERVPGCDVLELELAPVLGHSFGNLGGLVAISRHTDIFLEKIFILHHPKEKSVKSYLHNVLVLLDALHAHHGLLEGGGVPREQEDVLHDGDGGGQAEAGHVGADRLAVDHRPEAEDPDEDRGQELEPKEQPAVGHHLHVEEVLVLIDSPHAVVNHLKVKPEMSIG